MKKVFISIITLTFFTLQSCGLISSELTTITIESIQNFTSAIPDTKANEVYSKDTDVNTADINKKIEEANGKTENVKSVKVKIYNVSIPDNAGWNFSDVESIEASINGKVVGKNSVALPAVTSFNIPLIAPSGGSLPELPVEEFLDGSTYKVNLKIKFKKDVKSTVITGKVTYEMELELS